MVTSTLPRPAFDREVMALMPPIPESIFPKTKDGIPEQRAFFEAITAPTHQEILSDPLLNETELMISGPQDDIKISILRCKDTKATKSTRRPGILHIHGGGLTGGNLFSGANMVAEWVKDCDAVAVLIEYRRPPEHPFPAPLEDCYTALVWMVNHAESLGIDVDRVMVEGQSAGGGLAAAVALMARDKDGPKLCAQLLGVPGLDHRSTSMSCRQFPTGGTWNTEANTFLWQCYLGKETGKETVSYLASPSMATDLFGLPPAYIDVSCAEPFRDEATAYAAQLWHAGVQAELHVWSGGSHAFDVFTPAAAVSRLAIQTRSAWVKRLLSIPHQ
ncbi:alpha/beta hydrolase fold protein [Cadophora sp. DSE1049]|nr:alpha/beta hydrolase fold protein [Cadophora sp. DSE1049]